MHKASMASHLTPFLLARLSELTGGESLKANLKLLLNNARLAAQIAQASGKRSTKDLLSALQFTLFTIRLLALHFVVVGQRVLRRSRC